VRIDVFTLFPDMVDAFARESLLGKARERGLLDVRVHDVRTWAADDVHRTLDDAPYGGGPGMVMTAEPWARALEHVAPADGSVQPVLVIPTPSGRPFTQAAAARLAAEPWLAFACGRYEGIDARFTAFAGQRMRVEEVSLGDYVLAGGEVAAMVVLEAVGRLVPGVMGNATSGDDESFSDGLLEYPQYTRPATFRDWDVPDVLRSGDHGRIARWRRAQALARTLARRPDLVAARGGLSAADRKVLAEFGLAGGSDGGTA
jgi:tRNA (guanine37-N1)-methyltransferase